MSYLVRATREDPASSSLRLAAELVPRLRADLRRGPVASVSATELTIEGTGDRIVYRALDGGLERRQAGSLREWRGTFRARFRLAPAVPGGRPMLQLEVEDGDPSPASLLSFRFLPREGRP